MGLGVVFLYKAAFNSFISFFVMVMRQIWTNLVRFCSASLFLFWKRSFSPLLYWRKSEKNTHTHLNRERLCICSDKFECENLNCLYLITLCYILLLFFVYVDRDLIVCYSWELNFVIWQITGQFILYCLRCFWKFSRNFLCSSYARYINS